MATSQGPRKLVAYLRVSTKGQGDSGLGLEAQEAAVSAHAASSGSAIVGRFVEVESGRRADRPELLKAIAHAKRARSTLVIAKLDRLSRNVAFLANLMEAGVDFVACDQPNANRLTVHILAAVAENEAMMISQRTKAALAAYKARGGRLGTNNLTADGMARGRLMGAKALRDRAVGAYADLLPLMTGLKAEGATLRAIADRLNADGHLTRTGGAWGPVQVMRALGRVE